jgi:hypothetical protein
MSFYFFETGIMQVVLNISRKLDSHGLSALWIFNLGVKCWELLVDLL